MFLFQTKDKKSKNITPNLNIKEPSASLYDELVHSFQRDAKNTPLYKDLPRLIDRITVVGHSKEPPKGYSPIPKSLPIRNFMQQLDKQKNLLSTDYSIEERKRFSQTLEDILYYEVDKALTLISPKQWQEIGIPNDVRDALLKQALREKKREDNQFKNANQNNTPSPRNLRWSIDISALRSSSDIDSMDKFEVIEEDQDQKLDIFERMKLLILDVASRFEDKSTIKEFKKKLNELRKGKSDENQLEAQRMFEIVGVNSKTAKVLQMISQNIIFIGLFHLKNAVPMTTLTRDVRDSLGWRIKIEFDYNVVSVSHFRREQSLATEPEDEQYWFEWELRMVFDMNLNNLESGVLRIRDLGFSKKSNPAFIKKVKELLGGGHLIIE